MYVDARVRTFDTIKMAQTHQLHNLVSQIAAQPVRKAAVFDNWPYMALNDAHVNTKHVNKKSWSLNAAKGFPPHKKTRKWSNNVRSMFLDLRHASSLSTSAAYFFSQRAAPRQIRSAPSVHTNTQTLHCQVVEDVPPRFFKLFSRTINFEAQLPRNVDMHQPTTSNTKTEQRHFPAKQH